MATSGILLIDKEEGWTSHDVVARTRRVMNTRKVGHAGTLDPMATGLLVLGVGSSTRLLTYLVGLPKVYAATIRLGAETVTDDREGEVTLAADPERIQALQDERIEQGIQKLTGRIMQAPSAVSAIKVDGKRAYDRVRQGEQVELNERPVDITEFSLLGMRRATAPGSGIPYIELDVVVGCSSGTYIRALARDLGRSLGVGGHLAQLRRLSVGPLSVTGAKLVEAASQSDLIPPVEIAALVMPPLSLTDEQTRAVRHGKRIPVEHEDAPQVAAMTPTGELIGVLKIRNGVTKVLVNFPMEESDA